MENLDNLKVTVIEKNACTVTASSVMVGLPTLVGPVGPVGPTGPQGPAGPSGQGAWGTITGDITEQTDLQDALDLKADTADLGDMATVDDAPSNGQEYVRKNGDWAVSSGGGGGGGATWGSITGTLSSQTDLQIALDAKQNTLTFDTTPTAASTNPVTSGGIKTYTDNKILYFYQQSTVATQAATTEFCRITDSRIDANTVVLNCDFTVPSAITSGVSWTSAAGYISFKGICTSTNCKVNAVLGQKGN